MARGAHHARRAEGHAAAGRRRRRRRRVARAAHRAQPRAAALRRRVQVGASQDSSLLDAEKRSGDLDLGVLPDLHVLKYYWAGSSGSS